MATEEIIILASSKKHGGRCIAGVTPQTPRWVRPVSPGANGELYPYHCGTSGKFPRLLDVVRFDHGGSTNEPDQPENVRIGAEPWEHVERVPVPDAYERLRPLLQPGPEVLGSRQHYVDAEAAAQGVEASLALIEPTELSFSLDRHSEKSQGSPRAMFNLGGQYYDLPLTEYIVRPRLLERGYGMYTWEDLDLAAPAHPLLVTSLGTPFNERHYKLVAAVLPLP